MNPKHLVIRAEQCMSLARASNCTRRQVAALLLNPERNTILMDGYNGGPRGGERLCGGEVCLRDGIETATRLEVGCYHAEMNVICNAAANGVSTRGAWLIVTAEPCLLCAKLIYHAGIARVVYVKGGYTTDAGIEFLRNHGVVVEIMPPVGVRE